MRRPLRIFLACMLVLLLSQGLIGFLSLSSLGRQIVENTGERVELMARRSASQVQAGIRLGKPLAQYFGLDRVLDELRSRMPDLQGASVVLEQGQVLASIGDAPDAQAMLAAMRDTPAASPAAPQQSDARAIRRASGAVWRAAGRQISVAVPLFDQLGKPAGAVVLTAPARGLRDGGLLADNLRVLGLTTAAALLVFALLLRFAPAHRTGIAGGLRLAVPLCVMLLAQGGYAASTIQTFRDTWIQVTRDNTLMLAQGLQLDLQRVLGYGIAPDRLNGIEKPMSRLAASFPAIKELRLARPDGTILYRADAHGPRQPSIPSGNSEALERLPLTAGPDAPPVAVLQVVLNEAAIAAGVRERMLDAATVAAVAMVVAIELLLLSTLLMDRRRPPRQQDAPAGPANASHAGALVRPVMFGFLFAMALPLSFLPLYARSLLAGEGAQQAASMLMAIPISVEMGCGLLTVLLAGRLTDRRGWAFPVGAGLALSVAGNLACAVAGSLTAFILARGMVGLGYGLVWMGLQGFVVIRSPAARRGANMALVVAGLFAGHLSGAAVGGMLMQQLGASVVFIVGAVLLALPALGVFALLWPHRRQQAVGGAEAAGCAAAPGPRSGTALRQLLGSRDYGMLLLACVVPFSIAQVGLLTYALPLYMEAHGGGTAGVGRILMLYGLCVIYVGPWMGRLADRSLHKKRWIVAGGLAGSAGLIALFFFSGVMPVTVAVVLLALASCLAGGAQTAYMLSLRHVQAYGAGAATSIMRAADKFGQMLGPLVVGGLFAFMGTAAGLAVTGAVYLLATLAFMVCVPSAAPRPLAGERFS